MALVSEARHGPSARPAASALRGAGVTAIGLRVAARRIAGPAVVAIAWLWLAALLMFYLPALLRSVGTGDLMAYYFGAAQVRNGWPLYPPVPSGPLVFHSHEYVYPPFLAAALALLPVPSYAAAQAITTSILFASVLGFAAILARLALGRWSANGFAVALLGLWLLPWTSDTVRWSQIAPVLWLTWAAALLSPRARWPAMAAIALVKPFTVWPMLAGLAREPRSVLAGAGAVLLAACGVAVLAMGGHDFVASMWTWVREVAPALAQGTENGSNVAPAWLVVRALRATGRVPAHGALPSWLALGLVGSGVAAPLAMAWLGRRWSPAVRYGAIGAAAVLGAAYMLPHYPYFALPPLAAWWGERRRLGAWRLRA